MAFSVNLKNQPNTTWPDTLHPKSVKPIICVLFWRCLQLNMYFSFNDRGWNKFRSYIPNNTQPTSSFVFFFFFCISINAQQYKGSLTVIHQLSVTLLLFLYAWYHFWDAPLVAPVMGRLALSLFVLCTIISILLSLIAPPPRTHQKEFDLNSVKTDPVMLTWLCICK